MTTYKSVDLLDIIPESPDSDADARHVQRFASVVDDPAGAFAAAWSGRYQAWAQTFRYTVQTRTEIATLKAFLLARTGRYAPCWVPTWTDDLTLTVVPSNITFAITVRDPGAVARSLLGTALARYVAVIPHGTDGTTAFSVCPMQIGPPVSNGDGTYTMRTDVVYTGPTLRADQYRVSLLKFARLDTDDIALDYGTPGIVRAALPFVELPWETV